MLRSATWRFRLLKALLASTRIIASVSGRSNSSRRAWMAASLPAFWPAHNCRGAAAWRTSLPMTFIRALPMMRRTTSHTPIGRTPCFLSRGMSLCRLQTISSMKGRRAPLKGGGLTLANRPHLAGTVPIWRPKPDVPPDDPKKPIRPDLSWSTPKNTILNPLLPVLFVLQTKFKFFLCLLAFFHVPIRGGQSKQKICIYWALFWLKSSFSCHFPLNARNFVYILSLFFLAVNV